MKVFVFFCLFFCLFFSSSYLPRVFRTEVRIKREAVFTWKKHEIQKEILQDTVSNYFQSPFSTASVIHVLLCFHNLSREDSALSVFLRCGVDVGGMKARDDLCSEGNAHFFVLNGI